MTSILFISPVSTLTGDYRPGVVYSVDDTFAAQMIAAGLAQTDPAIFSSKTLGEIHYWPLRSDGVDRAGTVNLNPSLDNGIFHENDYSYFDATYGKFYAIPTPFVFPSSWSISFWVKPFSMDVTEVFWSQYADDGVSTFQVFRVGQDLTVGGYIYNPIIDDSELVALTITDGVTVQEQMLVCATFDETTKLLSLYAYGNLGYLKVTSTLNGNVLQNNTHPFTVGANSVGNYPANAGIRDVRMFNRAITDAEVENLTNSSFDVLV